jgi:hypothetical protein
MRAGILLTTVAAYFVMPQALAQPYADPHPCAKDCEVQKFLDQNIGIALDRPVTLAGLRKFAPVVSETTTKAGAAGLSDTVYEFRYAGLLVRAELTAEGTVLVQTIDLTGGAYHMPFNIKLGKIDGAHDIDYVLGPPAETRRPAGKPMRWIYRNLEGTEALTFERTDDALLAVHWNFTPGD